MHHLIASETISPIGIRSQLQQVNSGLYKLYIEYEWLKFGIHFRFHNRQIVEMQEGSYAVGNTWTVIYVLHLFGHPVQASKQGSQQAGRA